MNLWTEFETGSDIPNKVNAVIEIAKGSRNKYEYVKEANVFKLDRVLFSPFFYAMDYGFIPQTLYDDGDPMDIMVMMNEPTFPGCIIEARPIGLFKMVDKGQHDDKILAVPCDDPYFADYKDIKDVPAHYLKEVAHFFDQYKKLEGKSVTVVGWEGADAAKKALLHSIELYKKEAK